MISEVKIWSNYPYLTPVVILFALMSKFALLKHKVKHIESNSPYSNTPTRTATTIEEVSTCRSLRVSRRQRPDYVATSRGLHGNLCGALLVSFNSAAIST